MDSKILVIGSSNTDMTVVSERLPRPGETVLGGSFMMGGGGKGANQAVSAKRLGGDVSLVCKLGYDLFGDNAVSQYIKEGLGVDKIMRCSTPSGVALINVDKNAENCIVVSSGANAEIREDEIDALKDEISSAGILLLQLEIPVPAVLRAAKIAYESGVYVVLNPAPACELPDELYRYVSLLIPNQTEISLLSSSIVGKQSSSTQTTVQPIGPQQDTVQLSGANNGEVRPASGDYDDILLGMRRLFSKGVRNIILTQGSKGCLIAENPGITSDITDNATTPILLQHIAARKVKAVDTTAAGDTFCAAVCVALSEGKSLREAAEFATVASSLTVQKAGAQGSLPYRNEIA